MSLQKRIILVIVSLILGLLAANVLITVSLAREKLFEQLESHAQDAATSLGLSISLLPQSDDSALIETMINSMFDSGYYHLIRFKHVDQTDAIARSRSTGHAVGVPEWFASVFPLPAPTGKASVSSGWLQVGSIDVVGHSGLAYQDLWRTFKSQLLLFLVAGCLCIGLSSLIVHRLLEPLRQLQAQAEGIARREFTLQTHLPRVPEIRKVTVAMNRMVTKIQAMFQEQLQLNEQLHHQLNTDALTQLNNRDYFDRRLSSHLSSDKTQGSLLLIIISFTNLEAINREYSREQGDDCVQTLADVLKKAADAYDKSEVARHQGADFALYIPYLGRDKVLECIDSLLHQIDSLTFVSGVEPHVRMGAAFSAKADGTQSLMALADKALTQSIEQDKAHILLEYSANAPTLNATEWRQNIANAIKLRHLCLYYQPVWRLRGPNQADSDLLFYEVTSTLKINNQFEGAGFFMPVATRLGLASTIDDAVIDEVAMADINASFCINISTSFLEQNDFLSTLDEKFLSYPRFARRVIFELDAASLAQHADQVRTFADYIKRHGARLSLHHFGQGAADFAYLQSLPVDYLKIDRFFIRSITTNNDHLFFVRSMIAIAKSCDIIVLAEGVEHEEQWTLLQSLGIDGGQGYHLGRPDTNLPDTP